MKKHGSPTDVDADAKHCKPTADVAAQVKKYGPPTNVSAEVKKYEAPADADVEAGTKSYKLNLLQTQLQRAVKKDWRLPKHSSWLGGGGSRLPMHASWLGGGVLQRGRLTGSSLACSGRHRLCTSWPGASAWSSCTGSMSVHVYVHDTCCTAVTALSYHCL